MTTPIVIGQLGRLTAAQLADALAPADPNLCGWLDGSCTKPIKPGSWLCDDHDARIGGPHES